MTETEQRQAIVAEALSWQGTKYHPNGRIKKNGTDAGGVDCGLFLLQTFENVGLVTHEDIPHTPTDYACNSDVPAYLNKIKEYAHDVHREPLPGDVIVYQFRDAKVPHHAAIVIDPEYIIHSYIRRGVEISNRKGYKPFEVGVYSFW